MGFCSTMTWLFLFCARRSSPSGPSPRAGSPGKPRQHLLRSRAKTTSRSVPAAGLDPAKVEYRARIEYLVKTRTGDEVEADAARPSKKKTRSKTTAGGEEGQKAGRGRRAPADGRLRGRYRDPCRRDGLPAKRSDGGAVADHPGEIPGPVHARCTGLERRLQGSTPAAPGPAETIRRHRGLGVAR